MGRLNALLFRIYNQTLQKNSNLIFRGILDTPPIETNPDADTVLYTVLDQSNSCAYLLAVKSFLRFCPPVKVVVQSDGSLTPRAVSRLQSHVLGLEVLGARDSLDRIATHADPRVLELALPNLDECHFFLTFKLLNVLLRFSGRKVILLDSDTIFFRPPVVVADWIRDGAGTCFHSDGGNSLAAPFRAMGFDFSKVDISAFNAGFIGFHNHLDPSLLVDVLSRIRDHDPGLFGNWEIEQAIWSVLFNFMANPVNLDTIIKDYVASGYWPYDRLRRSVLAHFIGSVRFKNMRYIRAAREVIHQLKTAPSAGSASVGASWSRVPETAR